MRGRACREPWQHGSHAGRRSRGGCFASLWFRCPSGRRLWRVRERVLRDDPTPAERSGSAGFLLVLLSGISFGFYFKALTVLNRLFFDGYQLRCSLELSQQRVALSPRYGRRPLWLYAVPSSRYFRLRNIGEWCARHGPCRGPVEGSCFALCEFFDCIIGPFGLRTEVWSGWCGFSGKVTFWLPIWSSSF